MSVQFGMAIDSRDYKKKRNGVLLLGKEEKEGRNGDTEQHCFHTATCSQLCRRIHMQKPSSLHNLASSNSWKTQRPGLPTYLFPNIPTYLRISSQPGCKGDKARSSRHK